MNQQSQEIPLGDTLWFALIAYIVVLLPWTVFFAHDFISDRWDTIRNTRRAGMLHLVVFILAPLLLAYISLQPRSREPDFKEMFTAITALLFGVYHLLRSLEGVMQLKCLKRWVTNVANLMDRGGYWQELQPFNEGNQCRHERQTCKEEKLSSSEKRNKATSPNHRKLEALRHTPDKMRVNNSIVDNELAGSQCPNVPFALHLKTIYSYILWVKYRIAQFFIRAQRDPVEAKLTTFVRWAVAFLAQFGDNWLRDVAGTALVQSELRRTNKRREFAVKVLAAATLRMGQTKVSHEESNQSDLGLNLLDQKSYLPLGAWRRVTKRDEDIVFSREEFASASLRTRFHMPGNNAVLPERDSNGNVHGMENSRQYRQYRSFFDPLIAEARSTLHPTLREYLQKHGTFSSQQLEWFAAFLCTQCVLDDNSSSRKHAKQDSIADMESSFGQRSENDAAIRLLRRQLGLEDSITSRTFFYPFLKGAYERHFWDNRAILEVSARIDNWIAICSGRHISLLEKRRKAWSNDKLPTMHGYPKVSRGNESLETLETDSNRHGSDKSHTTDRSKDIFKYHQELEIESLKYQLTDMQTDHWHMEHGLSFLGCVVESIRSALADQTFLSGSHLEGWCPELANKKVQFLSSMELWESFNQSESFDTSIQERLLWECQQGVYSSLRKKIKKRQATGGFDIHKEVEMMLLFVLGFPSIKIKKKPDPGDTDRNFEFTIRPMLAPQPLQVHVLVHRGKHNPLGGIKPTAVLNIEAWRQEGLKWKAPVDTFCWRDWRDSFEGRLKGRFQWQQDHFLPAARIIGDATGPKGYSRREELAKSTKEIQARAYGEEPPLVWEGWRPFRPGMAIFELKYILSSKERYLGNRNIERHTSVTEKYDDDVKTKSALLSAAMLRLDVLLGHGEVLEELQKDLQQKGLFSKKKKVNPIIAWVRGEDEQTSKGALEKEVAQLLNDAKKFSARAMYDLACNLDDSEFAKPELVFNLMQGALHIDRAEEMAKSLIAKLLAGSAALRAGKRQEAIEKARYAVELLWLDVEAKHKGEWNHHARQMNKSDVDKWNKERNGEKERLKSIINLHKQILREHTTGTMMNELAERIITYGATKEHEKTAIELYESAVIANADPRPILRLATIHASRSFGKDDRTYALDLLRKALDVAKTGPHDDILDTHTSRLQSEFDVMKELYELKKSRDRGAIWLLDKLGESKLEDDIRLYAMIQHFEKLDMFAGSDESELEEVTIKP